MTDVSKLTILKLLADLGTACADYHDRAVRNVPCKRVQADEVWSFVGAKQKNVVPEKLDVWGDLWTWTTLDADTKLIVSYKVGPRRPPMAFELTFDLAARVASQNFQLTTDGLPWYAQAVEAAFGIDVDYATQAKHYAGEPTATRLPDS